MAEGGRQKAEERFSIFHFLFSIIFHLLFPMLVDSPDLYPKIKNEKSQMENFSAFCFPPSAPVVLRGFDIAGRALHIPAHHIGPMVLSQKSCVLSLSFQVVAQKRHAV